MRAHRLAGPHRAGGPRRLVADGEHEIHFRRLGQPELVPAFRAQAGHVVAQRLEQVDGVGMGAGFRLGPGGKGAEPVPRLGVQDRLGDQRARRIAVAQKQHVLLVGHGIALHSTQLARSARRTQLRLPPAALIQQEPGEPLNRHEVGGIAHPPPLAARHQQPRLAQLGEVGGHGVLLGPHRLGDLTGKQALWTCRDDKAERVEAKRLRQGGKGGCGAGCIHISGFPDILIPVKRFYMLPLALRTR